MARRDFFQNRIALITGASRGIGRGLALAFARRGASLALAARTADALQCVAGECQKANPHIETLVAPTDVTDRAALERLVEAALGHFGRIDILVNDAGIVQGGAFLESAPDILRRHLEVNLLAVAHLTRLVAPHMVERGQGVIVNMSSIMGRHVIPYFGGYAVSKHALNGFSEGLRRELAGTGVRVLNASIGFADTGMVSEENRRLLRPFGVRIVPVERVARRVLQAITRRRAEIEIGGIEFAAQWITRLSPRLADWMWAAMCPPELKDAAARQRTE